MIVKLLLLLSSVDDKVISMNPFHFCKNTTYLFILEALVSLRSLVIHRWWLNVYICVGVCNWVLLYVWEGSNTAPWRMVTFHKIKAMNFKCEQLAWPHIILFNDRRTYVNACVMQTLMLRIIVRFLIDIFIYFLVYFW